MDNDRSSVMDVGYSMTGVEIHRRLKGVKVVVLRRSKFKF